MLHWNKPLWLDVLSHAAIFNQSFFFFFFFSTNLSAFISALRSYDRLNFFLSTTLIPGRTTTATAKTLLQMFPHWWNDVAVLSYTDTTFHQCNISPIVPAPRAGSCQSMSIYSITFVIGIVPSLAYLWVTKALWSVIQGNVMACYHIYRRWQKPLSPEKWNKKYFQNQSLRLEIFAKEQDEHKNLRYCGWTELPVFKSCCFKSSQCRRQMD